MYTLIFKTLDCQIENHIIICNPSDDPLYTIMVVLEKEGLPASAGGMCGPIFAQTMDLLVETYQLQPMLTRQYEEVDEVIEVVDTVAIAN